MGDTEGTDETINLKLLLDEIRSVKTIATQTNEDIAGIKGRLEKLEMDNEQMKEEVVKLNNAGTNFEDRVENQEKYSRQNNLIVSGIQSINNDDM